MQLTLPDVPGIKTCHDLITNIMKAKKKLLSYSLLIFLMVSCATHNPSRNNYRTRLKSNNQCSKSNYLQQKIHDVALVASGTVLMLFLGNLRDSKKAKNPEDPSGLI